MNTRSKGLGKTHGNQMGHDISEALAPILTPRRKLRRLFVGRMSGQAT